MDVTVRQIRSFLAVAQTGSFTQAAAALRVSQPTLTVMIRRLEDALRVRLLDRTSRSVSLTRVGRDILPILERTVQDLDVVLTGIRDIATQTRGIVRLATLPSFAAGPLPEIIRRFRERHSGASFHIRDVPAGRGTVLLQAEEVDLAILGGEVSALDIQVLARVREGMVVVFPKGHPIEREPSIDARTLAGFPLVLMHPDTSVRVVVEAAFRNAGLSVGTAVEATYMMTAVGMVRAGLGLAVLPTTAREVDAEPALASRVIDDPGFVRSIVLAKKHGRTLPPLSEAFAEVLGRALQTV